MQIAVILDSATLKTCSLHAIRRAQLSRGFGAQQDWEVLHATLNLLILERFLSTLQWLSRGERRLAELRSQSRRFDLIAFFLSHVFMVVAVLCAISLQANYFNILVHRKELVGHHLCREDRLAFILVLVHDSLVKQNRILFIGLRHWLLILRLWPFVGALCLLHIGG
jgi:hypothetical protein